MSNDDFRRRIGAEAQRVCEDCVYSAKGHFNAAQLWDTVHLITGTAMTVLSAVAGASALRELPHHNTVAGGIAIAVSALSAAVTFAPPRKRASQHHDLGSSYNRLKNRARVLVEVDLPDIDEQEARARLEELELEKDNLNDRAPLIPAWAYRRAQRGIEQGEADYAVDQPCDIDID